MQQSKPAMSESSKAKMIQDAINHNKQSKQSMIVKDVLNKHKQKDDVVSKTIQMLKSKMDKKW